MRKTIEFEEEFRDIDFDLLDNLRNVLVPFFIVTDILSGSKYPSMGLIVSAISTIEDMLASVVSTNQIVLDVK